MTLKLYQINYRKRHFKISRYKIIKIVQLKLCMNLQFWKQHKQDKPIH